MKFTSSCFYKGLIFSLSFLIVTGSFASGLADLFESHYPDVRNLSEPTTDYPQAFTNFPFNPPVDAISPVDAEAPRIAEWTRQGGPGDTLALTAERVAATNALFMVYGERLSSGTRMGIETACNLPLVAGRECAVTLPENLPPHDVYLMWPCNNIGFGEPVPVNAAEAWWVGFNRVSSGETFYVYGRNLSLDGGTCWLYNAEKNDWIESKTTNPYRAEFECPPDWATGTYTLYAHNGHGGKYGWAEAQSITVAAPESFAGTTYNFVTDFNGDPSEASLDVAAYDAMTGRAKSGDTVIFPAGTFTSTKVWEFQDGIRYIGAGKGQTIIKGVGPFDIGDIAIFRQKDRTEVHDMTLEIGEGIESIATGYAWNFRRDTFTSNVTFLATNDFVVTTLLDSNGSIRQRYQDCDFVGPSAVTLNGSQLRFKDCVFSGIYDVNQLATLNGGNFIDLDGCVAENFDTSDPSWTFGWAKGRWIVVTGSPEGLYIGDCMTDRLMPRVGTPFLKDVAYAQLTAGERYEYLGNYYTNFTAKLSADIPDRFHRHWDDDYYNNVKATIISADGTTKNAGFPITELDAINNEISFGVLEWWAVQPDLSQGGTISLWEEPDGNAAEQILFEGAQPRQAGRVLSGANSSIFIDGAAAAKGGVADSTDLFITGGRGLGQARPVSSVNIGTGEVVIEGEWRVIPDSSSTYSLGTAGHNIAIYNSTFSGRKGAWDKSNREYQVTANTALQLNNAYNTVFANNIVSNIQHGFTYYSHYSAVGSLSGECAPGPNFFVEVIGNEFTGVQNGIRYMVHENGQQLVAGDAWNLGNVFRDNRISKVVGGTAIGLINYHSGSGIFGVNIFEDNMVAGVDRMPIGTLNAVDNQVFVDNQLTSDERLFGMNEQDLVLFGNTWSGAFDPYAVNVPRLAVARPRSIDGTVEIRNTGSADLTWTSSTLGGGTIAPEQYTNLINVAEGMHYIQSAGQSVQVEVAQLIQAYLTNRLSVNLSGYKGKWVIVEVPDLGSGEIVTLGPWYEPSTISFDVPDRYVVRVLTSVEQSGPYEVEKEIGEPPRSR